MNITRHISINDSYIEKIKPYLKKHNGNFGATIRELIIQAGKYNPQINASVIDISFFNWMLKETDDILIPDNVLDELIDPELITSMEKLEEYLNSRFSELNWHIDISLKADSDSYPSDVLIEIRGAPHKTKLVARILSQYLVKNSLEFAPLKVSTVINYDECITVKLSRSNKMEAKRSLITFFGKLNDVIKTIKSRPDFWKTLINRYEASNYNMVMVHRSDLEDLLSGRTPTGEVMIENLAKKPIQDIPLKEMLSLIKDVYETSRIVDRVDIDKESITLYHNYRNKRTIEKLKSSLVALLGASGYLYDAKATANMIVLTHREDVGIKIDEIVHNLEKSHSSLDQELIIFMAFIKGLKDIPDIPLSLTVLGREIGKSMMQEYEKENNVRSWNLETFQKALETIDSRLHRTSELKLNERTLLYKVKKCNIATEGGSLDSSVCRIVREAFKGALNYVLGNKAKLEVKHLLTRGDKFCEVIIRIT